MSAGITPGPWRINIVTPPRPDEDYPHPLGLRPEPSRMLIGTDSAASLTVAEAFWDIPTAEANARLIAAAPELLAACEAVVEAANREIIIGGGSNGQFRETGTAIVRQVRAAITKATRGGAQ